MHFAHIKKLPLLLYIFTILYLILYPSTLTAYNVDMQEENAIIIEEPVEYEGYESLFRLYSDKYNVDYRLVRAISYCENTPQDTNLQAKLKYNFTNASLGIYEGEREYSFGLVMINLHYNPTVTIAQATDPHFAIDFLARNLSKGNHSWWSCYTNGGYLQYI